MSDAIPGPSGTGSAIAQALANCANIGSVGSGRKLSGTIPPKHLQNKLEDLPPTYSSVAVQNTPNMNVSRATDSKVNSNGPVSARVHVTNKPVGKTDTEFTSKNISQPCIINGHNSTNDVHKYDASSSGSIGNPKTNDSNQELDLPIINGNLDSFSGSRHSPPGNKSKKKLTWFGKKHDSINDADLNGESEEEKRRKKIKWLWRSAALKSTARPKEQNGKHDKNRYSVS
jgi:hypothetical protein